MLGIPVSTIRNIIFFALGFAFGNVLVPHNAFAYTYDQTPNTPEILENTSINFQLSFDAVEIYAAEDCFLNSGGDCYYSFYYTGVEGADFADIAGNTCKILLETGNSISDSYIFPLGGVEGVGLYVYTDDTCQSFWGSNLVLWYGGAPNYAFSIVAENTGGGGGYVPPHFDLIGGNDLLASVGGGITNGVQETGKSMWPMFAFLGVLIAFIIALQVSVFTKRTIGGSPAGGKNRKAKQIPDEYGPDHPDYKAYKRGRSIIEKEHPGFYDE